jgi:DoxX-like protein
MPVTTTARTTTKGKKVFYWASTGFTVLALTVIAASDLLRVPAVMAGLIHLGYPAYVATILGFWKLLGSAAILSPGHPRLKEWAYAGMFFTLTGAALSHTVSGDPVANIIVPLVLLGWVMTSWALQSARQAVIASDATARQIA